MNSQPMQALIAISDKTVEFKSDLREELRARHRLYRAIRDISGEYTNEEYYWHDDNPLGDSALLAAAEEFTNAAVRMIRALAPEANIRLSGNGDKVFLADYFASLRPTDVAELFDPDFGILTHVEF